MNEWNENCLWICHLFRGRLTDSQSQQTYEAWRIVVADSFGVPESLEERVGILDHVLDVVGAVPGAGDPGDVVHDELGRHRLARPALPADEDQSERVTRSRDQLSANHSSPLTWWWRTGSRCLSSCCGTCCQPERRCGEGSHKLPSIEQCQC